MKRIGLLATVPACVGAIALGVSHPTAQRVGSPQTLVPVNALPNPYRTVENYFKLPAGRTWGATSAVAVDTDGKSIWVAERCGANSCAGSPLPPILHFDAQGNLLTAFGAGMFVAPHGIGMRAVPRRRARRRRRRADAARRRQFPLELERQDHRRHLRTHS